MVFIGVRQLTGRLIIKRHIIRCHGQAFSAFMQCQVIQKTDFRQAGSNGILDVLVHGAVCMVAKGSVDVVINHKYGFAKSPNSLLRFILCHCGVRLTTPHSKEIAHRANFYKRGKAFFFAL